MSVDVNATLATVFAGISAAGVIVDRQMARRGGRAATRRQDQILAELTGILLKDLADEDLALVTTTHVRGMAFALAQRDRSTPLSGKIIAEAVRAAALEVENRYAEESKVRRIIALNNVLKELDSEGPTLFSIASVNQVAAYVRSQPFAVWCLFVFVAGAAIAGASLHSTVVIVIAALLLAAEALLLWGAVRAIRFWTSDRPFRSIPVVDSFRQAAMNPMPGISRGLSPRSPTYYLPHKSPKYYLPHRSLTYYIWVGIWEELMMRSPSSSVRLIETAEGEGQGSVGSFAEHAGIRKRRIWRFVFLHQFRVDVARPLVRELLELQRERDLAQIEGRPPPDDRDAFSALCRRLWVVSGDEVFRRLLEAGEIPAAEYANPVLRCL